MRPFQKRIRIAFLLGLAGWLVIGLGAWLVTHLAKASPIVMPPPEFDHPFLGREIVEVLPDRDARKECWRRGYFGDACAWWFPDNLNPGHEACHLIFPSVEDVVAREDRENRRHENAHCAPPHWPANHPNGHYE